MQWRFLRGIHYSSHSLCQDHNPPRQPLTFVTARPFALHLPAVIRMTTTAKDKLEDIVLIPDGNDTIKIGRNTSNCAKKVRLG